MSIPFQHIHGFVTRDLGDFNVCQGDVRFRMDPFKEPTGAFVSQVMPPYVVDFCSPTTNLELPAQVVLIEVPKAENPFIFLVSWVVVFLDPLEDFFGNRGDGDLSVGLGFGGFSQELYLLIFEIHLVPLQLEHFTNPTSCFNGKKDGDHHFILLVPACFVDGLEQLSGFFPAESTVPLS